MKPSEKPATTPATARRKIRLPELTPYPVSSEFDRLEKELGLLRGRLEALEWSVRDIYGRRER